MAHVVDAIAAKFLTLLTGSTAAGLNVSRDRSTPTEARKDLPWIDIKIGDEEAFKPQIQGEWRATVLIHVDMTVEDVEASVSSVLQTLRAQAYAVVMATANVWPTGFLRVLPAPADAVQRSESGSTAVAFQRTAFAVLYQHSLTDATQ